MERDSFVMRNKLSRTDIFSILNFQIISMVCLFISASVFPDIPVGFPGGSGIKESASNAGDPGSIPGLGRSPREGNAYPLPKFSCL